MTEPKPLDERLEMRLSQEDKAIITAAAERQGKTASELVREGALKAAKK